MNHILDNPIWEGLNTGNKHFASGNESVKYFPALVTTFAGFRGFEAEEFRLLYDMLPQGSVRATFIPYHIEVPAPWQLLPGLEIYQMIDTGHITQIGSDDTDDTDDTDDKIVKLTNKDIPEMLNLTRLTNPGPFNERTIEFGNFFGIFSGDQLVAMAGQRLQVHEYSEISAVCTHPDHQGHGYARRLLLHQLKIIRGEDRKPMLHVKIDNKAAVSLYESLGFEIRRKLEVIIFRK
ncbi:GNAT family N-acetyltransferase [Flavitalea sp.]|nr:GNAT family N-acetyltransferase [Flavitalea sp.]